MAPQEKKWTDAAERDLCMAILYGNQSRYDWARVTKIMDGLGYDFTKDAMSQHFTKTILKKFKALCPESVTADIDATPPASATKPKATPRKTASTPRKRTKKAAEDNSNNNDDEVDDEMAPDATPTKKQKKEDKVKKEEKLKNEEEAPATPAAAADQSATSDSEEKARASDAESSA
ncbi:hypothetical protein BBK36DRAFT_1196923 [Trichoderma citrinoviride]|uniref:Myb-like domain-containing protein n=1 Tax=Trichoderma citrinoviride TaxID=58853 RepID=A0A2T4BE34_9HYPO|nr:hypothetical protein BBK36DRAFT_1196923 [Trichoderma citrinoviride]PTB67511.1 hypothetical protein BBK36DRAFT_1196923 [Trichoderma citrinoviride]